MDFRSMIRRGLGRAVFFLEKHDAKVYREDILHACRHFIGYDAQVELSRGRYLFDLIEATGEPEYYAPHIRAMLLGDAEAEMPSEVFELAAQLVKSGDSQMRVTMYQAFVRNAARRDYAGAEELVELDGVQGYKSVVEQWLRYPLTEDNQWFEGWLLDDVEKRCGAESVSVAISQLCSVNPEAASYFSLVRERRAAEKASRKVRSIFVMPHYEQLKVMIVNPEETTRWYRWRRYGEKADKETVLRLAHDLLTETDRGPLLKYLHLFCERRFPLEPSRLLELARDIDTEIAAAACQALSHISDARVRALALDLVASVDRPWEVVDLLVHNHEDGDYEIAGT